MNRTSTQIVRRSSVIKSICSSNWSRQSHATIKMSHPSSLRTLSRHRQIWTQSRAHLKGRQLQCGPQRQYFQEQLSPTWLNKRPQHQTARTSTLTSTAEISSSKLWRRIIKIKIGASRSLNSLSTHPSRIATISPSIHSNLMMEAWRRQNQTFRCHPLESGARTFLHLTESTLPLSLLAWCTSLEPGSSASTSSTVTRGTCAKALSIFHRHETTKTTAQKAWMIK